MMGKSEYNSLAIQEFKNKGIEIHYRLNSKTSLGFKMSNDRIERRDDIIRIFEINNVEQFKEKYEESSTGSGHPYADFDALRSSALCSLLSFYNVHEGKELIIDNIVYDKVYFEFQNVVMPERNPSNMDVVLVSKDNKTILFLESKFSEYKTNSQQIVSKAYIDGSNQDAKNLYDKLLLESINDQEKENKIASISSNPKDFETFIFKTEKAYSQGTKQVVSHLIAISNFIKYKNNTDYIKNFAFYDERKDKRKYLYHKYERVIFREIFFKLDDYSTTLNDYVDLSKRVRKVFQDFCEVNKIDYQEPLYYQEVFKGSNYEILDPLVALFYKYNK